MFNNNTNEITMVGLLNMLLHYLLQLDATHFQGSVIGLSHWVYCAYMLISMISSMSFFARWPAAFLLINAYRHGLAHSNWVLSSRWVFCFKLRMLVVVASYWSNLFQYWQNVSVFFLRIFTIGHREVIRLIIDKWAIILTYCAVVNDIGLFLRSHFSEHFVWIYFKWFQLLKFFRLQATMVLFIKIYGLRLISECILHFDSWAGFSWVKYRSCWQWILLPEMLEISIAAL